MSESISLYAPMIISVVALILVATAGVGAQRLLNHRRSEPETLTAPGSIALGQIAREDEGRRYSNVT